MKCLAVPGPGWTLRSDRRRGQRAESRSVKRFAAKNTAPFVGLDRRAESRCRKIPAPTRCEIRRSIALAGVEHPFADDGDADAPESFLEDLVILSGLAAFAELQVFAKKLLLENIFLKLQPLAEPTLIADVVASRFGAVNPSSDIVMLKNTLLTNKSFSRTTISRSVPALVPALRRGRSFLRAGPRTRLGRRRTRCVRCT